MRRVERRRAERAGETPRTLSEILIGHMMSPDSRPRIENRPIIKVLERGRD